MPTLAHQADQCGAFAQLSHAWERACVAAETISTSGIYSPLGISGGPLLKMPNIGSEPDLRRLSDRSFNCSK